MNAIHEGDRVELVVGFCYETTVHSIFYIGKERYIRHKHQYSTLSLIVTPLRQVKLIHKYMTLKDLEIGDRFYNLKDRQKKIYVVRGKCLFNRGAMSSTRKCSLAKDGELFNKLCRNEVVKTGVSDYKERYLASPLNTID